MSVCPDGDRNNSLTLCFVGFIDLAGHGACCVHDGAAVVWSPRPRGHTLGLSYWCPPNMHTVLIFSLHCSRFSYFCPELKSGVVVT
jgi:hypothetical protein